MKFHPDATLYEAMTQARGGRVYGPKSLILHYEQMVSLGAPRAERPRYGKYTYDSDTAMIAEICRWIERNEKKFFS
jgi:hypothetical protein